MPPLTPEVIMLAIFAVAVLWLINNLFTKWAKDIGAYYGPQKITLTTSKTPAEIHRAMQVASRKRRFLQLAIALAIWAGLAWKFPDFRERSIEITTNVLTAIVESAINLLQYLLEVINQFLSQRGYS